MIVVKSVDIFEIRLEMVRDAWKWSIPVLAKETLPEYASENAAHQAALKWLLRYLGVRQSIVRTELSYVVKDEVDA
jgi:hypothetical protein